MCTDIIYNNMVSFCYIAYSTVMEEVVDMRGEGADQSIESLAADGLGGTVLQKL